jgi:hypothetical protein
VQPSFPPESAPLEVDRVEWVPASPEAVHVHLLGRWIDRPVSDPLVLLVGTERRRHAFDALDNPPPGVLAAFAVPNELRSRLSVDIALQIGANEMALPGAGTGTLRDEAQAEDEEGEVIDRAVLAERRARRAEMAEDQLTRRAAEAEQTAGTLETQLANLEERLGQAREERDELEAQLADAERRLKAAQQREYAEQQQRIEAQDEVEQLRRGEDGEIGDLRRKLEAANRRAEDMAREVDRARRGIAEANQRAEADRLALQRVEERIRAAEVVHQGRGALEGTLAEVEARASDLQASLAAERAKRQTAEAALAAEREEASAKVTLLEHELQTRAAVQERIVVELRDVRTALDAAREEVSFQDRTESSVAQLSEIADRLKDRIVDLERRKEIAEAQLAETRDILSARTAELERAKLDLERAQRDAELLRMESSKHETALEQANRTIEAVRASAGELQLKLDVERRERAEAEAALHESLSRARAEGQRDMTEIQVELRTALESERRKFTEQVASIEKHVAGLREQVAGAAAELRDSLDAERAARQAAERQLADERARVTTERTAASEALAQLALEQARRRELEEQVTEALSAVRGVQAQDAEREARDAAVQRLVTEVLGTAASLREAFEAESRKLEGELTAQVVEERQRMAEELSAMESRAGDLQDRLEGSGSELESELQAERTARWLAEAEVARLRQGGAVPPPPAAKPAPAPTPRPEPTPEPVAEEPAAPSEAQAIVRDLAEAAERLREATPPVAEEATILPSGPPGTPEEDPSTEPPAETPEAGAVPPLPDEPVLDPSQLLAPRLVSAAERPSDGWLAGAIERLAGQDAQAAAKLIVALLPVQRLIVAHDATYDLTVTELGTFRVQLHAGATTVEPQAEPGGRREIDFHLEGAAGALSEFAGGGIKRRPKGTHLEGSRRKLKKLLKELRDPIQLSDVARSGALIEPGLILAALAAGIDPAQTAGHTFTVAWHVTGQRGGTWTVKVGDGFPTVSEGEPEGGATAVVHIAQGAFLPLLAGVAPPPGLQSSVTGNANAVALLRAWFDGAQKLA